MTGILAAMAGSSAGPSIIGTMTAGSGSGNVGYLSAGAAAAFGGTAIGSRTGSPATLNGAAITVDAMYSVGANRYVILGASSQPPLNNVFIDGIMHTATYVDEVGGALFRFSFNTASAFVNTTVYNWGFS